MISARRDEVRNMRDFLAEKFGSVEAGRAIMFVASLVYVCACMQTCTKQCTIHVCVLACKHARVCLRICVYANLHVCMCAACACSRAARMSLHGNYTLYLDFEFCMHA